MTISSNETMLWIMTLSLSFFFVMSGEGADLVAGVKRLCAALLFGLRAALVTFLELRPSLATAPPQNDLSDDLPDADREAADRGVLYRVIVTFACEYHLLDQVCAGVRDRGAGRWLLSHAALDCPVGGSVMQAPGRQVLLPGALRVGESMWFSAEKGNPVRTDPVLGVESRTRVSRQLLALAETRSAARERARSSAPPPCPAPEKKPAAGRAGGQPTAIRYRRSRPMAAVPIPSAAL